MTKRSGSDEGMRTIDLCREAMEAILARPVRSALTALGAVFGIGAFVTVLGVTTTAAAQLDSRFTALVATEVTVTIAPEAAEPRGFPADAESRLNRLNGVERCGLYWTVKLPVDSGVSALAPGTAGQAGGEVPLPVVAASPGFLSAAHTTYSAGTGFNTFHTSRAERVALLGEGAARRLGITRIDSRPAVFVDGQALTVIGIVRESQRRPDLLLSVIVPDSTAVRMWGKPEPRSAGMLIETSLGAAQLIARQAPLALSPEAAQEFRVAPPPDPRVLRDQVKDDSSSLFLILAAVSLVVSTFGIANTTLMSVLERVPEIGLRRAFGAQRHEVATQFLLESALTGGLGGLVGAAGGVVTVVVVASVKQWTPVLDPSVGLSGLVLGFLSGLVAGAYPAWRATRIEPAEALRR